MAEITMPQLGETVTEGTIVKWLKKVGDPVAHDEPLFEVSTDKVDSEVPSSSEGVLTAILVAEGETVDVGTPLAIIGDGAELAAAPPAPAPPAHDEHPPAPVDSAVVAPASAPAVAAPVEADGPGVVLSPLVRRLLAEHGLTPAQVRGTGEGGRITRDDVLAAAGATGTSVPSPAPSTPAVPASPPPVPAPPATHPAVFAPPPVGERDQVVPFTNIRRLTAEHMVRSKATSAHTLVAIEADYEAIERVRRAHKERFREEEGFGLTYLPFVARAVVDVLRDFPHLNASVGDNALIVHRDVNLGIAVDLDRQGLIVPVVRHADGQSLRGLARAMNDLATRARAKHLSADDIVGGTFTVTNPGPFGTFISAPIINQPQVAILSTDGVKRRPVVVTGPDGSEAIAIHSVGLLALCFDHRAVDGAYASAFLAALAGELTDRDWEAEL